MLQPRNIGIIVLKRRRSYYDYSKTLLAAQGVYNWLNAMKISSSRFSKEPESKTHHEFSDTITRTVKNISTEEVSSITIYLLLYDKANQLITVETGYADVTPLLPQDTSQFL